MSALFIILVSLTMTLFSGKMLLSNTCICGFIPNSHKKSWTVSTTYFVICNAFDNNTSMYVPLGLSTTVIIQKQWINNAKKYIYVPLITICQNIPLPNRPMYVNGKPVICLNLDKWIRFCLKIVLGIGSESLKTPQNNQREQQMV